MNLVAQAQSKCDDALRLIDEMERDLEADLLMVGDTQRTQRLSVDQLVVALHSTLLASTGDSELRSEARRTLLYVLRDLRGAPTDPTPDATEVMKTAEALFNSYNAQGPNPGKTFDGRDVPPWEKLSLQVQQKWAAVARAALALR